MRSRSRSSFVVVALMLVVALVMPANALATIKEFDREWIFSSTNPGAANDYDVVWREGWGNDPLAQFRIVIPQPDDGEPALVGAYYYVTRPSVAGTITVDMWDDCYNAVVANKTTWNLAIDFPGEFTGPGPLWDSWLPPGAPVPTTGREYEGPYQTFVHMYATNATETARGTWVAGLDLTPPAKVTGLVGRASASSAPLTPTDWLRQSRIHLRWDDKLYDTMAGTGYFELFMDGKPYLMPEKDSEVSRRVYDLKEHYPGYGNYINTTRSTVIEDLPAGKHTIQVRAVDRATNEGALSDPITIQVDPDFPTIAITHPAVNGQVVNAKPTFKADVTDLGGVKSVKFYVDNVLKWTDTSAPYTATVDLNPYANGSSHVLKVVATDMADRQSFAEADFVLDKTAPNLTAITKSASPFYPVQMDSYRDDFKVSFTTNEVGSASLIIKDSKGKVVRTISKSAVIGSNTIVWDGKNSSGKKVGGTYTWTLACADAVGNTKTTGATTVVLKAKTDETPPKITKTSANYTTFYPRKRDGYKDDLKMKFTVNEPGTAKLTIKNSKGTVVRTVTKTISKAGASSITWNGKYTSGSVKAGTFSYKLSVTDKAGNTSSAKTRKVKIKFYQLVKTSGNTLKVVER